MKKLVLLCVSLCGMALLISASPARAQLALWVASNGNDAQSCLQAAPCATFQGAINKGNVSQINCLTSGNYGPFTVTASITIDCGAGNVGNVVVAGSPAITLNTASAATVVLRHLSLNNLGVTTNGIGTNSFSSGMLIVEDCMFHGFASGISLIPTGGRGLLQMSNSQMFGNTIGVLVTVASGQIATVSLNQVELVANSNSGLILQGSGVAAGTMRHSVVGGNGQTGVLANAGQVYFTVEESSVIANLGIGISTITAGSNLNVTASTISGNGTGVSSSLGNIISFGNNTLNGNGSNGSFTSTTTLR